METILTCLHDRDHRNKYHFVAIALLVVGGVSCSAQHQDSPTLHAATAIDKSNRDLMQLLKAIQRARVVLMGEEHQDAVHAQRFVQLLNAWEEVELILGELRNQYGIKEGAS